MSWGRKKIVKKAGKKGKLRKWNLWVGKEERKKGSKIKMGKTGNGNTRERKEMFKRSLNGKEKRKVEG